MTTTTSTPTTVRTNYYVDYPRGFANEYTVYAVVNINDEVGEFEAAFPKAERITRREAIRLGWTRPRQARRDGEQWFGGFAREDGADRLEEALTDCVLATRIAVVQATAERAR